MITDPTGILPRLVRRAALLCLISLLASQAGMNLALAQAGEEAQPPVRRPNDVRFPTPKDFLAKRGFADTDEGLKAAMNSEDGVAKSWAVAVAQTDGNPVILEEARQFLHELESIDDPSEALTWGRAKFRTARYLADFGDEKGLQTLRDLASDSGDIEAAAALASASFSEPPEALEPAHRHIHLISEHDGEATLAASLSYVYYGGEPTEAGASSGLAGADVRSWCASLPREERYTIPECVAIEEFDRMKAGDVQGRATLFKAGPWRETAAGWLDHMRIDPVERAAEWADSEARFIAKCRWAEQVSLIYHVEWSEDDQEHPHRSLGSPRLEQAPDTGRFWGLDYNYTRDTLFEATIAGISLFHFHPDWRSFPKVAAPPASTTSSCTSVRIRCPRPRRRRRSSLSIRRRSTRRDGSSSGNWR